MRKYGVIVLLAVVMISVFLLSARAVTIANADAIAVQDDGATLVKSLIFKNAQVVSDNPKHDKALADWIASEKAEVLHVTEVLVIDSSGSGNWTLVTRIYYKKK